MMSDNDPVPPRRWPAAETECPDSIICEFSDTVLAPDTTPRPVSPEFFLKMPRAVLHQIPDDLLRKYFSVDLLRQIRPDLAPPDEPPPIDN